jgi:hypothetical protein
MDLPVNLSEDVKELVVLRRTEHTLDAEHEGDRVVLHHRLQLACSRRWHRRRARLPDETNRSGMDRSDYRTAKKTSDGTREYIGEEATHGLRVRDDDAMDAACFSTSSRARFMLSVP